VLHRAPIDPPRHELAEVDAAALEAARATDVALAAAIDMGADRWISYLSPLPGRLRDDGLRDLRIAERQARAAYGPRDSIRDALPEYATEPLVKALDKLLKAIARFEAHR